MKNEGYQVRTTPIFKLKDKKHRSFQAINLKKQFGFLPETIIVEKVKGMNNALIVRAIVTPEQAKLLEKEKPAEKKVVS